MLISFPVQCMTVSSTKAKNSTIPPVNINLVAISYQIILTLGGSVLLVGFKLRDELLDVYGVDKKN